MTNSKKWCFRGIAIIFTFLTPFAKAALPEWVQSPPHSQTTLYAIGEGRTLQQSTDVALKNILGQLRTRVSGEYQHQQSLVNDNFSESIRQSVSSSIENLPISQYQLIENHKEAGTFYTLVSVEKTTLASTFNAELNSNVSAIQKLISEKDIAGSSLEWWYSNRQELLENYATNVRYIEVLSLLDWPVDDAKQATTQIENKIVAIRNSSCLYVKAFHQREVRLALRERIVAGGIAADNASCPFQLDVNDKLTERFLFNKHIATLTMTLVLEHERQPLVSHTITETGSSLSDKEFATTAAFQRLIDKLRSDNGELLHDLLVKN